MGVLIISSGTSFAQESFEMAIGGVKEEVPHDILSLGDEGYTVLGRTRSFGAGGSDVILFKVNSRGELQWAKTYGMSVRDAARHFIRTSDNGYLIAAWKTTSETNDDWHIIRTDAEGNILWERFVGESRDDEFQDLVAVGNEYFLVGSSRNYGPGNASIFYVKMDDNGNFSWFKSFGSFNNDHAKAIIYTGNSLVLGIYSSSFGNGSKDFMLSKTDREGNILWSKNYPTSNDDFYRDLIETDDNGYLSVGFSNSFGSGDNDMYVLKTDSDGKVQWAKTYGGIADDKAYSIKKLRDGNFVIGGSTKSFGSGAGDVFVLKIAPSGGLIWAKTFGGTENEDQTFLDTLNNGGVIIVSSTLSFGSGDRDFFLIKTDGEGNSCCSQTIDNVTVRDVDVAGDSISFPVFEGAELPFHNMQLSNPLMDQELVCAGDLKIIGDTIFCGDAMNVSYSVIPGIEGDYFWTVPQGATIISGQGSEEIVVNFGGNSGYISVSLNGACSGSLVDSLYVNISGNIDINLGPDTSFCYGYTLLLSPGGGYYAYYWQDGSTDSVLLAGLTGYYWVQVTDSTGCTATDSVYIEAFLDFGFSIGPDTSVICQGDYLFLHGPGGYASYLWQDGSNYPDFVADTAGIYWLEITDENGCAARDSMLLMVNTIPEDFLGPDTSMCRDDYFPIHAPPGYDKYLWQDGSTDSVFIAWETGTYWVYVEDSIGCSGMDTISLSLFESPSLNYSNDTAICPGFSIVLSPGAGWTYYLWNTGSTDSAILVTKEGLYWVETGTRCGPFTDSIFVGIYANPGFSLGADTNICEDETIKLSPGSGFYSYLWNDGSTDSVLYAFGEGGYWVEVNDGRCFLSDSLLIGSCSLLWIPNVFTPNGDGVNDEFYAVGNNIWEFKLVIFNRWGEVIKILNNIDEKWDGRYNGQFCADGVYYYIANYKETGRDSFPITKQINGAVTLIRGENR